MNKVGMMIDVSHVSEGTFWDVIKYSKDPIFASHSSVKALCDHDRNLTDDQLRALAKNGGVIQICIYDGYLNNDAKAASIDDIVKHIDHAVKVAGIDHVGIGSDFDGGGGVLGCKGDNDMINITVKLIEKGYSEEDIRKIWGGNFFRVMNQVINK
jgi:microsomal dipeptidase-like Zn-dependent dipeptidase